MQNAKVYAAINTLNTSLASLLQRVAALEGTITFSQINETVQSYLTASESYVEGETTSVIGDYVTTSTYSNNWDDPAGYGTSYTGTMSVTGEKTYSYAISGIPIYNVVPNSISSVTVGDASFNLEPTGDLRMIYMSGSAHNIRDLGGWACDSGKIAYNKMFRGGALNSGSSSFLNDLDQAALSQACGITYELDLRGSSEAGITSSFIDAAGYYCTDDMSVGETALSLTGTAYSKTASIVTKLMELVIAGETVYFHCAAGADRTGLLAMLAEACLGVSRNDCDRDYELTCFSGWSGYHDRLRSNSTHVAETTYLASLTGDSWRDKAIYWMRSAGIEMETINNFRAVFGCSSLSDPLAEEEGTNQLPLAVDADGNSYNDGAGYKSGYRLNSAGNEASMSGMYVTGFIPVTYGQTVTFESLTVPADNTVTNYNYSYIACYNSDKTLIASNYSKDYVARTNDSPVVDGTNITSLTMIETVSAASLADIAYIRLSSPSITSESAIYVTGGGNN